MLMVFVEIVPLLLMLLVVVSRLPSFCCGFTKLWHYKLQRE
jgi:hypothetical protein